MRVTVVHNNNVHHTDAGVTRRTDTYARRNHYEMQINHINVVAYMSFHSRHYKTGSIYNSWHKYHTANSKANQICCFQQLKLILIIQRNENANLPETWKKWHQQNLRKKVAKTRKQYNHWSCIPLVYYETDFHFYSREPHVEIRNKINLIHQFK